MTRIIPLKPNPAKLKVKAMANRIRFTRGKPAQEMIQEIGQGVRARRGSSFRIQIKLMRVYYHVS